MNTKLTSEVVESYLNCKYKAHLKLAAQAGTKSEYETLLIEARDQVRHKATAKIVANLAASDIERDVALSTSTLKRGASYLFDLILENDQMLLVFDGLKRVTGPSKLGDFHYIPMIFHEGRQVSKEQNLLLSVYGLLLSRVQGAMPVYGIIWHSKACKTTRVRLNADLQNTERLLRDLEKLSVADSPPQLMLNDHCHVCEFRQSCYAQAIKEDHISLLRSLGTKEIKNYSKKGILTVTQLAHTFRPRRKPRRQVQRSNKRHHALHALAIRDKRIYVFGTPELAASPIAIYLDIESTSREGLVYLIGMIIDENGTEKRYSFWADNQNQERSIFEQFLAVVSQYENFLVFCYGSYEKTFLKRMRRQAKQKKSVDKILGRLVNVLSIIYPHVYFPTYSNGLKDVGGYLGCSWTDTD